MVVHNVGYNFSKCKTYNLEEGGAYMMATWQVWTKDAD